MVNFLARVVSCLQWNDFLEIGCIQSLTKLNDELKDFSHYACVLYYSKWMVAL